MRQRRIAARRRAREQAQPEARVDGVGPGGARKTRSDLPFLLVANLPYNVATPIISNLLQVDPLPAVMVVTIQKELADRLIAQPGTKDYGAVSVWVQTVGRAEWVRDLPPTVFWPRPKVQSAIVRIDTDPQKRAALADRKFFHETLRALFFHRRKYLRNVVISATKGVLSKGDLDRVLAEERFDAQSRIEDWPPAEIARLIEGLRRAIAETSGPIADANGPIAETPVASGEATAERPNEV